MTAGATLPVSPSARTCRSGSCRPDRRPLQFSLGKSFPGFGPIGPWIVSPDELNDPDDLALGCSVNGEEVQKSRTSDLIFGVGELVAPVVIDHPAPAR